MPKHRHSHKPAKAPAAAKQPWLTVRNETKGVTEMVIAGVIGGGWWDDSGITSKQFRDEFKRIPAGNKIVIRINSEGGSVSDALEIYNLIQRRAADVTTFNDGYALSSASVILLAGGRVICPHSSLTMIHEPWSMTVGNETDHLRSAEMLAKHGDTIAEIYARRTGKPASEMRDAMRAETWLTGAEANAFGMSDAMSDTACCPECEHEQCAECTAADGEITCSECGATSPAIDWEEGGDSEGSEEDQARNRFRGLNLAQFKNVPASVLALVGQSPVNRPTPAKPTPSENQPTPAAQLMDRNKILAALKKAGITLPDNSTDEQILAEFNKLTVAQAPAPAPAPTPAPAPVAALPGSVVSKADFDGVVARLDAEKRTRITAEVTRRAEGKVENKNLNWWVNLAMTDETATLAQIDALPVNRPGGEPIGVGGASVLDGRMDQIKKEPSAAKRFALVRDEWDGLIKDAFARDSRQRNAPMMANTYSATLVTAFLIDGAVTKLQNRWAALKIFCRDYSVDRYKPRATGQLKFATDGSAVQTNATDFESNGDSTITNVPITVDQYTANFHVTNDELNSGLRMENLLDLKIAALADKVLAIAFAPVTAANFVTNAAIVRAPAAFAFSDMAEGWGALKKSSIKNAVLDGEYMARILNQPVFFQAAGNESGDGWKRFGWDNIALNTQWAGAGANVRGLLCNPQALGAIAGLPLTPPNVPGSTLQESSVVVPDVNIPVATYNWFSLQTRTMWMSFDLMFGAALLDETAGVLIKSA